MPNRFFILTICLLFLFSSCDTDTPTPIDPTPNNALNKIMPLGASRVQGARPEFESYRYQLWQRLIDEAWEFDYIGTQKDEASYPDYAGRNFDRDHEGRGGWTSGQILEGLNGWLEITGAPDIVLLSSPGGNDALQGLSYEQAIDNINSIIDQLQALNPEVSIVIEQLAPARSDAMTEELSSFFDRMQQEVLVIANQQTTSTSTVVGVDIATGFTDSFFADDVHYNEKGAEIVAERYYEVLQHLLKR